MRQVFRSSRSLRAIMSTQMSNGCGPTKNRGALLVFEGCDRCGKSTQTARLADWLNEKGVAAKRINFPGKFSTESRTFLQCRFQIVARRLVR